MQKSEEFQWAAVQVVTNSSDILLPKANIRLRVDIILLNTMMKLRAMDSQLDSPQAFGRCENYICLIKSIYLDPFVIYIMRIFIMFFGIAPIFGTSGNLLRFCLFSMIFEEVLLVIYSVISLSMVIGKISVYLHCFVGAYG